MVSDQLALQTSPYIMLRQLGMKATKRIDLLSLSFSVWDNVPVALPIYP